MKKYIIVIIFICCLGWTSAWADEIVLETGKIISGSVLDLTENEVCIQVEGEKIMINRNEVEAVFLGEQAPFSSRGYPGLQAGIRLYESDVQEDEKEN
jgi:hypothetical protein